MQKPASKRQYITAEYFNYVKSELSRIRGRKVYKDLAPRFSCSVPTLKRIEEAADFTAFEKERHDRSAKATAAKINKDTPSQKINIPTPEEVMKPLFPKNVTLTVEGLPEFGMILADLAGIMAAQTVAIEKQTVAIQENSKAYKDLRDRMAVANQLKARELHERKEADVTVGADFAAPGSESKTVERIIDVKKKNKDEKTNNVLSPTQASV